MTDLVEVKMVNCPRCGFLKEAHAYSTHICVDCAKAENNRVQFNRLHHGDWMAAAAEAGIDVWVQQPGETQWEYTIWTAYRDSYPGKKPSYMSVATQLDTSYSAVRAVAQRWAFPLRMQMWMKYCDEITLLQRRTEILDMNKSHIDMASKIRSKLDTAIDAVIPEMLKPNEIVALAKLAADMEKAARIDSIAQDEMVSALLSDTENPDLKKETTSQTDLSEVVAILMKSGALKDVSKIATRQTTEVALVDSEGNSAMMTLEDK